jgi:hypothetical protein
MSGKKKPKCPEFAPLNKRRRKEMKEDPNSVAYGRFQCFVAFERFQYLMTNGRFQCLVALQRF